MRTTDLVWSLENYRSRTIMVIIPKWKLANSYHTALPEIQNFPSALSIGNNGGILATILQKLLENGEILMVSMAYTVGELNIERFGILWHSDLSVHRKSLWYLLKTESNQG